MLLTELFEEYMRLGQSGGLGKKKDGWRNNTVIAYREAFENHIKPVLGDKDVAEITKNDIENFRANLAQNKEIGSNMANYVISRLKALFKRAERKDLIGANPTRHLELFEIEVYERKILSPEQALSAIKFAPAHLQAFYLIMGFMGCRPSEIIALQWGDIDFESGTISITKACSRGVMGPPKTASSRRTIDIPIVVRNALIELQTERRADAPVFISRLGTLLDEDSLAKTWKLAQQKAGITDVVSLYSLRHLFASMCLRGDVDLAWFSRMLGHKNPKVTMSVYSHVVPGTNETKKIDAIAAAAFRGGY